MHENRRLIGVFTALLRILLILNIACGVLFVAILLATISLSPEQIAGRFLRTPDVLALLPGMRGVLVTGLLAVAAAHVVLRALRDIAVTVRAGDPFLPVNARRIRLIGWGLLALAVLDLIFGAFDYWLATNGFAGGGWTPSLTGWLAALAAFVLAEVWARGAAMRDDLAGTV